MTYMVKYIFRMLQDNLKGKGLQLLIVNCFTRKIAYKYFLHDIFSLKSYLFFFHRGQNSDAFIF